MLLRLMVSMWIVETETSLCICLTHTSDRKRNWEFQIQTRGVFLSLVLTQRTQKDSRNLLGQQKEMRTKKTLIRCQVSHHSIDPRINRNRGYRSLITIHK